LGGALCRGSSAGAAAGTPVAAAVAPAMAAADGDGLLGCHPKILRSSGYPPSTTLTANEESSQPAKICTGTDQNCECWTGELRTWEQANRSCGPTCTPLTGQAYIMHGCRDTRTSVSALIYSANLARSMVKPQGNLRVRRLHLQHGRQRQAEQRPVRADGQRRGHLCEQHRWHHDVERHLRE